MDNPQTVFGKSDAAPLPKGKAIKTQNSIALRQDNHSKKKKKDKLDYLILLLLILLFLTGLIIWLTHKQRPPVAKAYIPVAIEKPVVPAKDTAVQTPPPPVKVEVQNPPVTQKVVPPPVKEDKERSIRRNWFKYIHAANSSYAYGILGGISNLSVVFNNNSDYVIDEMVARVTYIKANGKAWKTKYVTIYHLPAHSDKKEEMPKVSRGKSVKVDIVKVVSRGMHFKYLPGKHFSSPDDPYYAR